MPTTNETPPLPPLEFRLLSEVEPRPAQWLWPGRVALGRLTLVAGEPGAGTSLLLLDIASRVSRGTPFSCPVAGAGGTRENADTPSGLECAGAELLGAHAESNGADTATAAGPADVLLIVRHHMEPLAKQRLAVSGADGKRIQVMGEVPDREPGKKEGSVVRPFRAWSDLHHVESWLARTPEAKLVVLDPLELSLDERGRSFPYERRQMLRRLGELAAKYAVAIIAAARVPEKPGAADLRRCLDKLAGVEEVGTVLAVVRDRRRPCRRYLLAVKNTLGETQDGLTFETPGGRIAWGRGGVSSAVLNATAGQLDQHDAALWLQGELSEGPRSANDLREAADESGFPWHVVYRAKAIAGAECHRKGFGPGSRVFWRLEDAEREAEVVEEACQSHQKEPDFIIENENPHQDDGAWLAPLDSEPTASPAVAPPIHREADAPRSPEPRRRRRRARRQQRSRAERGTTKRSRQNAFSDPEAPAERPRHCEMADEAADEQRYEPPLAGIKDPGKPIRMPWGRNEGVLIEDLKDHELKELLSWHRKRLDDDVFQEIERVLRQRP